MSWMLWYTTNVTTLTPAHKLTGLSPKKTVAADATNDDEGCDDVDDEDSAASREMQRNTKMIQIMLRMNPCLRPIRLKICRGLQSFTCYSHVTVAKM